MSRECSPRFRVVPVAARYRRAAVADRLDEAVQLCRARAVRLTDLRRLVLEILHEAEQPLGAYPLLERLEQRLGRQVSPPTVYRALDFLMRERLVARLPSRHAFVPCANPTEPHRCVLLVCSGCGTAREIAAPGLTALVAGEADDAGFVWDQSTIELGGRCARCQGPPTAPDTIES